MLPAWVPRRSLKRAGRDLQATGETVRKCTVEWQGAKVVLTQLG
jgi:hypothetical protein